MNVTYELWDFSTGNCVGSYDDEDAAFADVRKNPPEDWQHVVLLRCDESPSVCVEVASGADLYALAFTLPV